MRLAWLCSVVPRYEGLQLGLSCNKAAMWLMLICNFGVQISADFVRVEVKGSVTTSDANEVCIAIPLGAFLDTARMHAACNLSCYAWPYRQLGLLQPVL